MAAASGLEKLDAFAVSKVPVRSCLFVRPLPHRSDWLTMYEYACIIFYSYCISHSLFTVTVLFFVLRNLLLLVKLTVADLPIVHGT